MATESHRSFSNPHALSEEFLRVWVTIVKNDDVCNQKTQKEEEEKFNDKGCFEFQKFSSKVDYFAI